MILNIPSSGEANEAAPACSTPSDGQQATISAAGQPAVPNQAATPPVKSGRDIQVPDIPTPAEKPFCLDEKTALHPNGFPNQPANGSRFLPATIPNVEHILKKYGVSVRYDVIGKRLNFAIPGVVLSADSGDTAMTEIISLVQMNGLPTTTVREYVSAIGDRHRYNPAKDWIDSLAWDGVDRLRPLQDSIIVADGYPAQLRDTLVYRWMLSAVAAAILDQDFRARGVLTFQGAQGVGKTSWLMSLIPPAHQARFLKVDHHLDASNKDSILGACSHWIVEIGELDSSFRKDVARLKGFLTSTHDKLRRPYGRDEVEYPRRTVFAATVNDSNFLVDMTGNTRWWTIEVASLNTQHGIHMQQLFAQLAVDVRRGEQWWLTPEEEHALNEQNKAYMAVSVVRDRLNAYLAWQANLGEDKKPLHLTATQILEFIGFKAPNSAVVREATPIFKEVLGRRKKVNGKEGWAFPCFEGFTNVEQGQF